MRKEDCITCKWIEGKKEHPHRKIIHVDVYWLLTHYNGEEAFLGWMTLQPKLHRVSIKDLCKYELEALGPTMAVTTAIR